MERNKTLIEKMKERDFKLVEVVNDKKCFLFLYNGIDGVRKDIICEIYPEKAFQFVYTNDKILGLFMSGVFYGWDDDNLFEETLMMYEEGVRVLKDYCGEDE